jgi:DNA-binding protein YbaB
VTYAADAAAERWVADWSDSIATRAEQSWELARRVGALAVTAEGERGAVEVTVGGTGEVLDLRLTERARELPPARLAEAILTVMRRAQGMLAELAAELAAETVGTESATGRAVVAGFAQRFPPPTDDGDDRRTGGRDGWH